MFCWRITKYDPKNRDNGIYLKDEWTDYSDIGKIFDGKILKEDEYLKTEGAYINAVLLFMECLNVNELKIVSLEYMGKRPQCVEVDKITIANNALYHRDIIVFIIQSILRNKLWCKLELDHTMYVHFGWDYYMYIGSAKACPSAIKKIEEIGLFVEPFVSPYLEEEDE